VNLVVVEGQAEERLIPLEGTVRVGRAEGNTLRLEDRTVSSHHLEIRCEDGQFRMRNLSKTLGAQVNGERAEGCVLKEGDQIRLGEALLVVTEEEDLRGVARQVASLSGSGKESLIKVRATMEGISDSVRGPERDPEGTGKRLALLYELSRAVQEAQGVEDILRKAAEGLRGILEADLCVIFERSPEGKGRSPEAFRAVAVDAAAGAPSHTAVSQTLVRQALEEGKGVLTDDAQEDDRFEGSRSIAGYGIRSAMCVPLRGHAGIGGAVVVETFSSTRRFTDRDLEFMTATGAQVGVSLENAKLYFELQEAYKELKGLDKMRSDFVALVSHELRTPLTSITMMVEGIQKGLLRPEDYDEVLPEVSREAKRLNRVLKQFHDIHLLERGQIRMAFVSCDLADLVSQAEEATRHAYAKRNIRLVSSVPSILLEVDTEWMPQVLAHLLENAAKYGPEGSAVHVGVDADGGRTGKVILKVTDEGPGIPPDKREKVLSKFQYIEAIEHHAEGLGLGLPVAAKVVELHGGELRIEGGPSGKGTAVVIRLPLQ
jgi:K+-sensing histidine kinase KdpD